MLERVRYTRPSRRGLEAAGLIRGDARVVVSPHPVRRAEALPIAAIVDSFQKSNWHSFKSTRLPYSLGEGRVGMDSPGLSDQEPRHE